MQTIDQVGFLPAQMSRIAAHYSRTALLTLFLISAFPLHLWTILLWLRDYSWIAARTDAWDAIGVGAYGLAIALLESIVVFLFAILMGYLLSSRWEEGRRTAILAFLVLITASWAISAQLFFLFELDPSAFLIGWLAGRDHPLRLLYFGVLMIVTGSVLLPVVLLLRSDKAVRSLHNLLDRLALLSGLYLLLDAAGLVIVILRNVS